MHIGNTGLTAARKKLTTAGHNISNSNTEGFSRQRTTQEANPPVQYGDLVLGTGTRISATKRVHDKYLESKLGSSITEHAFYREQSFQLAQIVEVFNELGEGGLHQRLNQFFNAFRELSQRPEDQAIRSVVRERAQQLVRGFRERKGALNQLQVAMDRRIAGAVDEVNMMLRQVAKLNIDVVRIENTGGETGDLRDQRDLLVRKLAKFFSLNTYQDNDGNYIVNVQGVGGVVAGGVAQKLLAIKPPDSAAHLPGGVEVQLEGRPHYRISHRLTGGRLAAFFEVRNGQLQGLQQRMDDLAFDLVHGVNAIHRRSTVGQREVRGVDFFRALGERFRGAEIIDLSREVKQDTQNIGTAWEAEQPGDNRVAIAISRLQDLRLFNGGQSSLEDFYLAGVAEVSAKAREAGVNEEQAGGILEQNQALRESVSGVSLDEETADMIRFQQAFDAAARVMTVADEMFKTVLRIKKV